MHAHNGVCEVPYSLDPPAQPRRSQTPHPIICFSKADRWSEGGENRERGGEKQSQRERERIFEGSHKGVLIRIENRKTERGDSSPESSFAIREEKNPKRSLWTLSRGRERETEMKSQMKKWQKEQSC